MTDDLVARLCEESYDHSPGYNICDEAADRIEQLEAALREIIVHCEVPAPPNAEALKMFARKALERKDGQ